MRKVPYFTRKSAIKHKMFYAFTLIQRGQQWGGMHVKENLRWSLSWMLKLLWISNHRNTFILVGTWDFQIPLNAWCGWMVGMVMRHWWYDLQEYWPVWERVQSLLSWELGKKRVDARVDNRLSFSIFRLWDNLLGINRFQDDMEVFWLGGDGRNDDTGRWWADEAL